MPELRTETMTVNMGPQHPSTHGVLRLVLELDGETIRSASPTIGFLHTGIEKTAEQKKWQQVIPLVERMDYLGAQSNSLAYALSVEKLLGVEIPERVQDIRVLIAELQRTTGKHARDMAEEQARTRAAMQAAAASDTAKREAETRCPTMIQALPPGRAWLYWLGSRCQLVTGMNLPSHFAAPPRNHEPRVPRRVRPAGAHRSVWRGYADRSRHRARGAPCHAGWSVEPLDACVCLRREAQ